MATTPARQKLRDMLDAGELIVAPGVFDGVTAHLARRTGQPAAYMTGAGVAASGFGLPDIGLVTATEMAERARMLVGVLGVAASNYFYYVAIQRTSVAIAIVVQYTAPVWVLLYVVARRQQKLSLQKVAAVAVAITGIALTIGIVGTNSGSLHLDAYGIVAALVAAYHAGMLDEGALHAFLKLAHPNHLRPHPDQPLRAKLF